MCRQGSTPLQLAHDYSVSRLVAANLQTWRGIRGLSAQALADRCAELGYPHLDRTLIAKIESKAKRRRVLVDELAVFARALGVPAEDRLSPRNPDSRHLDPEASRTPEVVEGQREHGAAVRAIVADLDPAARWIVDGRKWLWRRGTDLEAQRLVAEFRRQHEMQRLVTEVHDSSAARETVTELAQHIYAPFTDQTADQSAEERTDHHGTRTETRQEPLGGPATPTKRAAND